MEFKSYDTSDPASMAEMEGDVAAALGQQDAPPVHEVHVTRLVTFIVSVEDLRTDQYDDDEEFDPQEAAAYFVDGLEGADVDNYATIHRVDPVPGIEPDDDRPRAVKAD
jgi:hypothetical protein